MKDVEVRKELAVLMYLLRRRGIINDEDLQDIAEGKFVGKRVNK